MKKFITLCAGIVFLSLFLAGTMQGQPWTAVGIHVVNPNNGMGGFAGIGNNAAPGTLLDVSRNMTEPIVRVRNLGGFGGATFQMSDVASGGDWKFKVVVGGNFKIRDQASALDVLVFEKNAAANSIYVKQGGNVGIGTTNPLEKLDVNGAVRIGSTALNNAGTIQFNGVNFMGFDGASWLQLDNVNTPPTWLMIPNPLPAPLNNPQLYPAMPPSSVTTGMPGMPNNLGWIHASDAAAPGLFPHLLACESILGGAFSASQIYQISNGPANPMMNYSVGLFNQDMTYKVCVGPVLTPTSQSDNTTMLRADPLGIIDLPNQSRIRAYQQDPNGINQPVFPNVWTPVNFTNDSPLAQGYDEQNEFIVAPAANMPTPPVNAFFMATKEGYYQVNARVEFNTEYSQEYGPVQVNPNSYVSIAIYLGGVPYAYGNNLTLACPAGPIYYNNAPNVSDVLYLMPQQMISIWVFQSANTPMDLIQGPAKVYVSIHKVS